MLGKIFKGMFGGKDEPETSAREVRSVRDLRVGDIIKFGFDSRPKISNQEFQIGGVHGFDFKSGKGDERVVLHLGQAEGKPLFLWFHEEQGVEMIALAYAAAEPEVASTLNMEEFPRLFAQEEGHLVTVHANGERAADNPWLASLYREEYAQEVYRISGDPRTYAIGGAISDQEEAVDFYRLVSPDRKSAIEVIVYEGGRTDVLFVSYLPTHKIEEFFPAA